MSPTKTPAKKTVGKKPATKTPAVKRALTQEAATKTPAVKRALTQEAATKMPAVKRAMVKEAATKLPAVKRALVKEAATKRGAARPSAARSPGDRPAPTVTGAPAAEQAAAGTGAVKAPAGDLPIIPFESPRAWDTWLAANHASSRGVWLKLAKKGTGVASVTYPEALEAALIWGWIDGQKGSFDDAWWLQKFTPRGPRSIWSKVNREKAQALIDAGRMRPTGLAAVESAKRDGRWEAAYDSPSKATVPEDLAAALAANPRAAAFFATLNAANRYAILHRTHTAKKAETRARRIAQFVEMLARHEKLHA